MRSRQRGFLPLLPLLSGAWSFLSKIPWWVWVIVAAVIFHFYSLHLAVHSAVDNNNKEWEAKMAGVVIEHNREMVDYHKESVAKSTAAQIEFAGTTSALQTKLEDALKRIPTHVTKADDDRCGALPTDGLRDLSDLATGQVPVSGAPSGHVEGTGLQPSPSAPPVHLSDLFASDEINITKLRTCSAEVTKWRGWYVEQHALCKLKDQCE